jgi:anti-sigma factor RsiW
VPATEMERLMHPTEGDLRAYHDDELSTAEQGRIETHLAACTGCRQQADQLRQRARWAQNRLALLAPEQPPLPARAARARLAAYPDPNKEKRLMKAQSFARQYRPLWSGLAVAAMLLFALLLPPVRALASDFLALFRVQRIQAVEVNPHNLPGSFSNSAVKIEQLISDNVQVEERGELSDAPSAAAASALAGFPVRLPAEGESSVPGERQIRVQPGARVTLAIDLPRGHRAAR